MQTNTRNTNWRKYKDLACEKVSRKYKLVSPEKDLLTHIVGGETKPAIAKRLGCSLSEIEERQRNLYGKLRVSSKKDLEELLKVAIGLGQDRVAFSFEIAGTSHYQKAAQWLKDDAVNCLAAKRCPGNQYDKNAVAIKAYGKIVGYVPMTDSAKVARLMDNGYSTSFSSLRVECYHPKKRFRDYWGDFYWDEDTDKSITTAYVTLVCESPGPDPAIGTAPHNQPVTKNVHDEFSLSEKELDAALQGLREQVKLNQNEIEVIRGLARNLSRTSIAEEKGWTLNKVKDNAKSAYRKIGIHSIDDLRAILKKQIDEKSGKRAVNEKEPAKKMTHKGNVSYVGIADFIVRSHGYSCKHKGHKMIPVDASVTVLVADMFLEERLFRAFIASSVAKYFITDEAYEKLTRHARLCCRVVEIEDIESPKRGIGHWANYAEESLLHQYGYNVSKAEGLTQSNRGVILSFVIENEIMTQYEVIAFIEGLIRGREGMKNMQDAIAKWKADISFLEDYAPPKRSLKVGRMYVRTGR